MKLSIAIVCCLLLNACGPVLYTHREVMDSFKTKQDLINRFGLPTEKRTDTDYEQWIYDCGSTVRGITTPVYGNMSVTRFNTYSKYMMFMLDGQGNVIRWQSNGVNLTQRL